MFSDVQTFLPTRLYFHLLKVHYVCKYHTPRYFVLYTFHRFIHYKYGINTDPRWTLNFTAKSSIFSYTLYYTFPPHHTYHGLFLHMLFEKLPFSSKLSTIPFSGLYRMTYPKSIKNIDHFLFFFLYFSINHRTQNIGSIVVVSDITPNWFFDTVVSSPNPFLYYSPTFSFYDRKLLKFLLVLYIAFIFINRH